MSPGPSRLLALTLLALAPLTLGACGSGEEGGGGPPTRPGSPDPEIDVIRVTPEEAAVRQDSSVDFDAEALDASGNTVSGVEFDWNVENPSIATVDETGRVTGAGPGETSVVASAEGDEGSSRLRVRAGKTMAVDSSRLELVSDSAEREQGTLRFRVRGASAPEIEPGDYLVGAQDGGFLRQVEQVSRDGGEIVAETEQAALAEAVDSASFESTVTVGPGGQTGAVRGDRVRWGPTFSRYSAAGVTVDGAALVISDLVLLDEEVCGGSGSGCAQAELVITSGQVRFSPSVELSAEVDFFDLERFRAVAEGDLEFTADAEASATGSIQSSGERPVQQFAKPFVFQAGPVPVAGQVRLTFFAGYRSQASASFDVGAGFESSYGTTLGAEWADGQWSEVFSVDASFSSDPLITDVDGEALARVYVKPELSVILYTAAGPSAFAEPYLQGETTFPESCTFDLTAGMDGGVGFQVEILSRELASFDRSLSIASTTLTSHSLGCGGELEVSASTTGEDPDPDGYRVSVDGSRSDSIGPNGSTTFTGLSPGDHDVELAGVASNCSIDGANPRTVAVEAGKTASTAFTVDCSGGNQPPTVSIVSPAEGSVFGEGEAVTFQGSAEDPEDGSLSDEAFVWTSDVDGQIGTGRTVTVSSLSVGPHVVTLTATDSRGATGTADVSITVGAGDGGDGRIGFIRHVTDDFNRIQSFDVRVVRPSASGDVRVAESLFDVPPTWSPDGTTLAFVADPEDDGERDIYLVERDGTNLRRLTSRRWSDESSSLVWSPDGTEIAFAADSAGVTNLWKIDVDGSDPVRLTRQFDGFIRHPEDWSPDGSLVLFQAHRNVDEELFTVTADGAVNVRRLTDFGAEVINGRWSPDGTRIVFNAQGGLTPTSSGAIFLMRSDGSGKRVLADLEGDDRHARWSPDGEWIAFETDPLFSRSVALVRPDGSGLREVTDGGEPSWSPLGDRLAFTFCENQECAIWVIRADGGGRQQITNSQYSDFHPVWSPAP